MTSMGEYRWAAAEGSAGECRVDERVTLALETCCE